MRCPFCGDTETQVKDSRPAEDHVTIRRRRFCQACGGRFTTYERVQLRDLTVMKKNGRRESFDRDKLARSIRIALQKRPIEADRIDQMISGCKLARDIVNSEPFTKYLTDERLPGQSIQTDAELEKFVRDNAFPMYHVSGTCRMGNDDEAVTDPELRVRGLDNFWVVDASIIPSLPAGNINASVIMIGEKGADHVMGKGMLPASNVPAYRAPDWETSQR